MRTLMKITVPVEQGNASIRDGRLPRAIQRVLEGLHPEAAYFYSDRGQRAALVVFDLAEPSQIPGVVEPLFQDINATVELVPVMNADELRRGLTALGEADAAPIPAPAISHVTA